MRSLGLGVGKVAVTMFDRPVGFDQPAELDPRALPAEAGRPPVKRPNRFSLSNWPVRWKVLAIALVPLLLAMVFGGLRVYASAVEARDLRAAADRAELLPVVDDYMAALENALVTNAAGGDTAQASSAFDAKHTALEQRLDGARPVPDVRLAVTTLLDNGKALLGKATANEVDLRQQVTTYAPLLLTAETAITGSVRVGDEDVRAQAEGLSRAVGARGQMSMQRMLIERGGDLPEPELRSSMIALAGTEPSTVMGMSQLLGGASEEASTLRSQMVQRLSLMSDPSQPLVDNPDLLASIQTTDQIAQKLISDTTTSITTTVDGEATHQRNNAIRDAITVLAAFLIALAIVLWVARSLVRPLRSLRDGALKIAHEDLARGIDRVKAGDEREPAPLPIHTTEEVGQVAHAVDELHSQALLLAGDEARLRVMVNDMFETMSRRNKSLVDQQLSLIDGLERNEEDPDRLDSLFRLDHLATRMRRNGANLLVLAGAQSAREHNETVPLASLINAAASEVEEYQRVEVGAVSDCSIVGSAATDAVHLLAELLENALRYSPPAELVHVRAVYTTSGGVLVEVDDSGLGMTDSDLRIANMRLTAGGEVSPDSARHMGLFVAGRLARQHDMTVRLLGSANGVGTTAELYLPPELLDAVAGRAYTQAPPAVSAPLTPELSDRPQWEEPPVVEPGIPEAAESVTAEADSDVASVTLLPRRDPGSSGIGGVSPESAFDEPGAPAAAEPWWSQDEPVHDEPEPVLPADTSGFFSSRGRLRDEDSQQEPAPPVSAQAQEPVDSSMVIHYESDPEDAAVQYLSDEVAVTAEDAAPPDTGSIDLTEMNRLAAEISPQVARSGVDLIYQNMISEWLVDPHELAVPEDWKSVWDNGWAAAAEAENKPVRAHTDHGLPVREPGARLVPGAATDSRNGTDMGSADEENALTSSGGFRHVDDAGENEARERDPDAIRASISNHFGGVRAARTHAQDTTQGFDE